MRTHLLLLVLGMSLAASPTLLADDPSWIGRLNPFKKDEPSRPTATRPTQTRDSRSNAARGPAEPSAWNKMTSGTKSFFSKTADALNPFDSGDSKKTQTAARRRAKPEKKGMSFPSWLGGGEPEDDRPQTVNDFLALPRPTY